MRLVTYLCSLFILTACGGSGSSSRPDTTPPLVSAPTAITVVAAVATGAPASEAAIAGFLNAASATDNVAVVGAVSNDAPSVFPIGVTQVTFSATDAAGNTGMASASVTVSEPPDTTAPVVSAPADLTLPASSPSGSPVTDPALVTFLTAATATDDTAVVGAITTDAPAQLPLGTTQVTFSASDAAGNVGTATASLTITDATDPTIEVPESLRTPAAAFDGSPATVPAIADLLAAASATDNVAVVGGVSNDAPALFPYGETTVTFTAVDAAGNEGTSTTIVHITMPSTTHLFTATNGNNGLELWRTDGTELGTVMIRDINAGGDAIPEQFLRVDELVYFAADDGVNGLELWKSDGSETGTVLVKDINQGLDNASPSWLTALAGRVYFAATTAALGTELWVSDGTESGTVLVKDISAGATGSNIRSITAFGDDVYFSATDGTSGNELFKSNGTEDGTVLVADINPDPNSGSAPSELTIYKGALYFSANTRTQGRELWRTDGTAANTTLISDIATGTDSSYPYGLSVLGDTATGTLLFAAERSLAEGSELWQTDGTSAGTQLLKDIKPQVSTTNNINGSRPTQLTVVGQTLYFAADTGGRGSFQLYKSDGTATGTVVVEDTNTGATYSEIEIVGHLQGQIYFDAQGLTTGRELWRSDGTTAGTGIVTEIDPNNVRSPDPASLADDQYAFVFGTTDAPLLTIADGAGLLTIETGANGLELWKTDGSPGNTVLIKDINPGPADGLYRGRQ